MAGAVDAQTSPWCYVASGAACPRCDGWRSPAKLVCCNVSWATGLPVALLCTVERARPVYGRLVQAHGHGVRNSAHGHAMGAIEAIHIVIHLR